VWQNSVQLFAVQECESRPETWNPWAAFEKAMPEEQIGGPEVHNKAKRLYIAVRHRLDGTACGDQFHAGNQQIRRRIDDAIQRLAIKPVKNHTFGSAGTQGNKPI